MATSLSSHFSHLPPSSFSPQTPFSFPSSLRSPNLGKFPNTPLVASSSNNFNASSSNPTPSKKSVLTVLIQDIEPLDISLIHKDVPPTTVDAMKRTVSSMLGLLPSDRFQACIEALWGPLSKLLVSSMMTGILIYSRRIQEAWYQSPMVLVLFA